MSLPAAILNQICPMHVVLDHTGRIRQAGPTLYKLETGALDGAFFLEAFELYRPRAVISMEQLLATQGRKLHMRLRNTKRTQLKGVLCPDGTGGAVVNLSFGMSVVEAVRDYALTSTDFAATDLTVEMLYLVEAKSAAMNASVHLNARLNGAKAEAEERSFTDGLTGLRNRRALDRVLERLCRTQQPFALMHLDLDYFKQVNDTYGHAAGDLVLRNVGTIMMEETRKDDTAARVGGDEFVVVLGNNVNRERLAQLATRLIERIEEPVHHDGQPCHVSASIGISLYHGNASQPARILEEADIALYASKRAGRAQFSFFSGGSDEALPTQKSRVAGE